MTISPKALREWAQGSLPCEAATELLLRAFNRRFAQPGWPWMHSYKQGRSWIDFEAILEHVGGLSGGEHRVYDDRGIPWRRGAGCPLKRCTWARPGVLDLVLAALAHAAGSHQDSVILEKPEGVLGFERVDTLHPWPKEPLPCA